MNRNLNLTTYCCLAWLLLSVTNINAQEKYEMKEITENNKTVVLGSEYKIVEPNSVVKISLNKNHLREDMAHLALPIEITESLKSYRDILAKQSILMADIVAAVDLYRKGEPVALWKEKLKSSEIIGDLINKDPELELLVRKLITSETEIEYDLIRYHVFFQAVNLRLGDLEERILNEAKDNGVFLQLGAWLKTGASTKEIHIPGFDTYEAAERYSVTRFQLILTAEQQAEFDQIAVMAAEADRNGLRSMLKQSTEDAIKGFTDQLNDLPTLKAIDSLILEANNLVSSTEGELSVIIQTVKQSKDLVESYSNTVENLVSEYKSRTSTDREKLALSITSDISMLIISSSELVNQILANKSMLSSQMATLSSTSKNRITALRLRLTKVEDSLKKDLNSLKDLHTVVKTILSGKQTLEDVYRFTDKVKKLTLDVIPPEAVIDLNSAGIRDLGDVLVVKMAIGKKGDSIPTKELMFRDFSLYYCSLYARTAVGFLFVDPVPLFKRQEGKALFRYSPSYSILLKGMFASRKNVSYHRFWQPGIGLNIATLDFDGDGGMEVGVGAVISVLNDFVQVGYGGNTFSGRGYSFFGLKLPVGAFTLR
ncbi:MAG: hypothetical protein EOP48_10695 [Sphingobacteriales bacterium]|nr:MAG: hypothetical protein EOP48_10695 [Sphingobacteriales bacterium]